ncbi:MAG TPA: ATP-dependent Clp protease proteolytic subunit [Polyangiales bacterium]
MSQPSVAEPPLPESPRVPDALFAARTVLIMGEVTPALAQRVTSQLLALASESEAPIRVFVHSPGGHVESGDTIHDVIRFIRPPVLMLGSGWVASAGALIFSAVERARRVCLPNTRFLLHEPSGGFGGQASDIEIEARQVLAMRARLNAIFARATGQPLDKIARDSERNHWLNAEEALAYGLIGRVVERASDLDPR